MYWMITALTASIALVGAAVAQTDVAAPPVDLPRVHLQAMKLALSRATISLRRASTANKGGFVERGRIDLESATRDINQAQVYLRAHPEAGEDSIPAWFGGGLARPSPRGRGSAAAPNVRTALTGVRNAWNELLQTPGGDLGGFRDKIATDLEQAALDLTSAINVAGVRGGDAPPAIETPALQNDGSSTAHSAEKCCAAGPGCKCCEHSASGDAER